MNTIQKKFGLFWMISQKVQESLIENDVVSSTLNIQENIFQFLIFLTCINLIDSFPIRNDRVINAASEGVINAINEEIDDYEEFSNNMRSISKIAINEYYSSFL